MGIVHHNRCAPISLHRVESDRTDITKGDLTGEIYKLELDGTIIGKFGHASKELGGFQVVHMMDCRNPNEIVVGEIESWRVQKLILQPSPK